MKKAFLKNCYSITLALLLLGQMGFHAVHVLSSHQEVHQEDLAQLSDPQIQETHHSCELCAKLLGQKLYVEALAEVGPISTHSFYHSQFSISLNYSEAFEALCLRGPPIVIC